MLKVLFSVSNKILLKGPILGMNIPNVEPSNFAMLCFIYIYLSLSSNQIFHYTRCNTPERVMSWRGSSLRHCAWATQLLLKKCHNGGEPLATLCPIWPARDLNLRPPVPGTNALQLDQLCQTLLVKKLKGSMRNLFNVASPNFFVFHLSFIFTNLENLVF